MSAPPSRRRYRFGPFTVSPTRRALLRGAEEVPLIPRYFDLLVLLLERRGEAVHRRDIRDAVWSDVVVSDGALSQAVRTLRRALGDDSREPAYIRTVSRHGYQFVFADVVEEPDEASLASAAPAPPEPVATTDPFEPALAALLAGGDEDEDGARSAAETLHALGTAEALRRLGRRPGHERGRALLRDARWDVPGSGDVPMVGQPGWPRTALLLAALRLRRAGRLVAARWASASVGGAVAGIVAALIGSLLLMTAPDSSAPRTLPVVLAVVGALVGGTGAAGVGAGLAAAEALARSARPVALVLCGACAGGITGLVANTLARLVLGDLFGHALPPVGGGVEGLVLGAAAGLGYGLATPRPAGGMATPHGGERRRAALAAAACCALAGLALTALGGQLTGASLNALARGFQGSQVKLEPLARRLGEREMGPATRAALAVGECALFGAGLVLGLTRRPR